MSNKWNVSVPGTRTQQYKQNRKNKSKKRIKQKRTEKQLVIQELDKRVALRHQKRQKKSYMPNKTRRCFLGGTYTSQHKRGKKRNRRQTYWLRCMKKEVVVFRRWTVSRRCFRIVTEWSPGKQSHLLTDRDQPGQFLLFFSTLCWTLCMQNTKHNFLLMKPVWAGIRLLQIRTRGTREFPLSVEGSLQHFRRIGIGFPRLPFQFFYLPAGLSTGKLRETKQEAQSRGGVTFTYVENVGPAQPTAPGKHI